MTRATWTFLVTAAVVAIGGAAGCGDSSDPRIGGTAVVAYAGSPRAANPLITSDAYSDAMNRFLLFLPLLRFDDELRPTPGLARSWAMEGDSAAVFELHRVALWSDGRPTTAEDVAFTLARALDPEVGYPNRAQIAHIHDVEVVDSFTVRLRFDPVREPLAMLASLAIVPRHALDSVPVDALPSAAFNLRPVTNGPFRLIEARPGDRWVFAADSLFPEELGGRPRLDRLVWRAIPESSAMATELQSGEVDVAVGVRADVFDRLSAMEGYEGIERPTLEYTAVAWNGRRPPLDDPRVRRALAMAVDRRQILDGLRGGHGTLANGPVPAAHWANASSVEGPPHDPDRARSLLADRGFRDRDGDGIVEDSAGAELRLTLLLPAGSDFNRDVAQVLQSSLRAVGVGLELRQQEFASLIQVITSPDRDFDAALLGLNADPRLDLRGLFHTDAMGDPFQLAGYSNPAVDSILDALETTDQDPAMELWEELQRILAEDQPWLYLHGGSELILARSRVRGIDAGLPGLLQNVSSWWLEAQEPGETVR